MLLATSDARPTIRLRPYQQAAYDAVFAEFEGGVPSTLVVHCTGAGKSILLGSIAQRVIDEMGGKVLVLAHREILIDQLSNSMAALGVETAVEKAERNARATLWGEPQCVVGSIQTMQRKRLLSWDPDHFKLVVIDESHRSVSKSYRNILEHLKPEWLLGVTATPDRLDGKNLGSIYKTVAHEYTLRQGINDGYLSPIKVVRCQTRVDLSKIKTTDGDLNQAELEEAIRPHIGELSNAIVQEIGDRRTIVFTPDVGSAEAMASALNSLGVKAESVSCYSDDRKEIFDGFRKNRFQVICNAQLLSEGADFPFVEAVVLARPTKSRGAFSQMVGRLTRLSPETGKQNGMVVDFTWMTSTHKLVTAVDLFDDGSNSDPEVKAMAKKALDDGETDDLMEAIERAEETKKERIRLKIEAERKAVLYRKTVYNPFEVATEVLGMNVRPESDSALKDKLTDKQLATLTKFGVVDAHTMSKRRASMMLDTLITRAKEGKATHKQVAFALRLGMDPNEAREMSMKEMSAYLDSRIGIRR